MKDLEFKVFKDGHEMVGDKAKFHIQLVGFEQTPEYKILPFTGKVSLDGELIYLGDVIAKDYADEPEDKGWCVEWDKENSRFNATCMRLVNDDILSLPLSQINTSHMRVVGNIHQKDEILMDGYLELFF